jgi:hypothetical protein
MSLCPMGYGNDGSAEPAPAVSNGTAKAAPHGSGSATTTVAVSNGVPISKPAGDGPTNDVYYRYCVCVFVMSA